MGRLENELTETSQSLAQTQDSVASQEQELSEARLSLELAQDSLASEQAAVQEARESLELAQDALASEQAATTEATLRADVSDTRLWQLDSKLAEVEQMNAQKDTVLAEMEEVADMMDEKLSEMQETHGQLAAAEASALTELDEAVVANEQLLESARAAAEAEAGALSAKEEAEVAYEELLQSARGALIEERTMRSEVEEQAHADRESLMAELDEAEALAQENDISLRSEISEAQTELANAQGQQAVLEQSVAAAAKTHAEDVASQLQVTDHLAGVSLRLGQLEQLNSQRIIESWPRVTPPPPPSYSERSHSSPRPPTAPPGRSRRPLRRSSS